MSNTDIISGFQPALLDIQDFNLLEEVFTQANILVYGEIHGIKDNADIIYTLIKKLGISQVAIEASPSVGRFIDEASTGAYDFSLIDEDIFDSSILSLEVIKTIVTLMGEGIVEKVTYIDTFFDSLEPSKLDDPNSPQKREQDLADNILSLDVTKPTVCLMGQWHTQPEPIQYNNSTHLSALYRLRQINQYIPYIHVIYKHGQAYNDGRVLNLPTRDDVSDDYKITQISQIDFDLHVPKADRITLPSSPSK